MEEERQLAFLGGTYCTLFKLKEGRGDCESSRSRTKEEEHVLTLLIVINSRTNDEFSKGNM